MSNKPLSEQLEYWRAERPSEWLMDEFIRDAKKLEQTITQYRNENNVCCETCINRLHGPSVSLCYSCKYQGWNWRENNFSGEE